MFKRLRGAVSVVMTGVMLVTGVNPSYAAETGILPVSYVSQDIPEIEVPDTEYDEVAEVPEMAASAAVGVDSIVMTSGLTLTNDSTYPWTTATYNGMTVAKPGNSGVNSSTSTMSFAFSGTGVFSFGCYTSTEVGFDKFIVALDGTTEYTLSDINDWQKLTVEVDTSGSHTLTIQYSKDGSVHKNEDTCYVGDVSFCQYAPESDFEFDSSTGTITGYTGNGGNIAIPSTIGGVAVTAIGISDYNKEVFGDSEVSAVVVPEGVQYIGRDAFGCTKLKTITLPDSLTAIENHAFSSSNVLEYITIPALVEEMYEDTFYPCSSLKAINVDSENSYFTSVDGVLFNDAVTELIKYPQEREGSYSIPDTVEIIGSSAFSNAYDLTEIIIPQSVRTIGSNAFFYCTSLTEITIPEGVEIISGVAFQSCRNVTEISIPSTVTDLSGDTFYRCSSLTNISVSDNNPSFTSVDGVLYDKEQTELIACPGGFQGSFEVPYGVTSIGSYAFCSCTKLTNVIIPDSVVSIGSRAFEYCSGLTNITVPGSVTSIASMAFSDCSNLEIIYIPSSVTSIGNYAFWDCSNLTSITIPSSVTSIGTNILYNVSNATIYCVEGSTADDASLYPSSCTIKYISAESNFTFDSATGTITGYTGSGGDVVIPSTIGGVAVKIIGENSFKGNDYIESIVIPHGVEVIDSNAFYGCDKITSIDIPSSIISIGEYAFYSCNAITNITIPNGVITIDDWAFSFCDGLANINIPDSVTNIGNYAFYWCKNATSVTIPNNGMNIGNYAFYDCDGISTINIPSSITSIGNGAFSNCDSLMNILVDEANTMYSSVEGVLYNKNKTSLLAYPAGKTGEFVIPDGVTNIGISAFAGCSELGNLNIPDSITSIGGFAFRYARLSSITIPSSVISIGPNILLDASDVTIYCVEGSTADDASLYPDTCTIEYIVDTSDFTFDSSTGTITGYTGSGGDVVIPSTIDGVAVTAIGDKAFYNDSNITSVIIPDGVTSIGNYTFLACSSLTQVTIPGSVTSIGNYAFVSCTGITDMNIPEGVTSIGYYAFGNCSSLTSINLPSSAVNVNRNAFNRCEKLTNISVDENNPYFKSVDGVLYDKLQTTILICPAGITGNFSIPSGITNIGEYAFYTCEGLTQVTIPDSVTSIGMGAFGNCSNLVNVNIPDNVTYIGSFAFSNCNALESITIPNGVTNIGASTFYACNTLTNVIIPDSVTNIGDYAFQSCAGLTSIIIPDSVTSIGTGILADVSNATIYCIEGSTADDTSLYPDTCTIKYFTEEGAQAPSGGFIGQGTMDANIVNTSMEAAGNDGVVDGAYLGAGFTAYNKGTTNWEGRSYTYTYTDGFSTTGMFQISRGNDLIFADTVPGSTVDTSAIEKALQFDSGGEGTITIYAAIGSSGVLEAEILVVDAATNTVVQNTSITRADAMSDTPFTPAVINIPGPGTYYILVPESATSLNVAIINVDIAAVDTPTTETTTAVNETTTEATTQSTTEATTEDPTEGGTYSQDTMLVQPVAPDAVVQDGKNVVDREIGETFNVNIELSQVENTPGVNNYTFFITYDPSVVRMKGLVEPDDVSTYMTYPMKVGSTTIDVPIYPDAGTVANSIALTPVASENNYADYADVITADTPVTATCGELGKVKFASFISASDGSELLVANNSGTLMTLSFEVVGQGDTDIYVDATYQTVTGFKTKLTSGEELKFASIPGNITIGDVIPTQYTITYDANGGTSAPESVTADYGVESSISSLIPEREGYQFVGWSTDPNATQAQYSAGDRYTDYTSITLYAVWQEITYTISYNPNGGFGTPSPVTKKHGETITLTYDCPQRSDFIFAGWALTSTAAEAQYQPGDEFDLNMSCTLYAVWQSKAANTYTITYDANGGTGAPEAQTKVENVNLILSDVIPTREGYRFMGWGTTPTTTIVRYEAGDQYTANAGIILYAVWYEDIAGEIDFPRVITNEARNITENSARLTGTIESDGGGNIKSARIVYYAKNNVGVRITAQAQVSGDTIVADVTGLTPDTEYVYYAAATNERGSSSGSSMEFKTSQSADPDTVTSISVSPEAIALSVGDTTELIVSIFPATADDESKQYIWQSSNTDVVTVDPLSRTGNIRAVGEGEAIITVTVASSKVKASCKVKVTEDENMIDRFNFSELNMAAAMTKQNGKELGWNTVLDDGGNLNMVSAYLTRWSGILTENKFPYSDAEKYTGDKEIDNIEKDADFHIQDIIYLPLRQNSLDNEEIKYAVMNYGAVYASIQYPEGEEYVRPTHLCNQVPYDPDNKKGSGHVVAIVGWDDNFAAENFGLPEGQDGAFLCKNSYGTDEGYDGYIYVSYYDANIGIKERCAVFNGIESGDNYRKVYQYDPLGPTSVINLRTTSDTGNFYVANVFPEPNTELAKDEELQAVSFYTYEMGATYEIYVVPDFNGFDGFKLGDEYKVAEGIQPYAGYHTVDIKSDPVLLEAGTRFAVIIKLSADSDGWAHYYVEAPVEYAFPTAVSGSGYYSTASNADSWECLQTNTIEGIRHSTSDFCIKAFTNGDPDEQTASSGDGETIVTDAGEVDEIFIEAGDAVIEHFDDSYVFPESFDLRDKGLVSSVKDQGNYNTCWSFAAMASIESNALRKYKLATADSDMAFDGAGAALMDIPVEAISIDGYSDRIIMAINSGIQLNYAVEPFNATLEGVIWSSEDSSVATIDSQGYLRAYNIGTTRITVSTPDGSFSASIDVEVREGTAVTGVAFDDISDTKVVKMGDVFLLDYTVSREDAANKNVTWSSSNPDVVTVSKYGIIQAVGEGSAVITCKTVDGGFTDTMTINVEGDWNCRLTQINNTFDNKPSMGEIMFGSLGVEVENTIGSAFEGVAVLSIYDSEGRFVYSANQNVTIGEGTTNINFNDTGVANSDCASYKLVIWSDLDSMTPLCEPLEGSIPDQGDL